MSASACGLHPALAFAMGAPRWRWLVEDQEDRTQRVDGSEPVREHPPEVPGPGRTPMQYAVVILGVLVLLAALLWFFLPAAG